MSARALLPPVRLALLALPLLAACAGSSSTPGKSYTAADVASMTTLAELMAVHKATTTGLWNETDYSADEWARAKRDSPVLKAAALQVAERFGGQGEFDDGFVDYANIVAGQADALSAAAEAEDAAAASAAMTELRAACDGCHGVYN